MNSPNPNSHFTAIERTSLSFPTRMLHNQNKIVGKVLNLGCDIGKDIELLQQKGFEIIGDDPHYFPEFPTEKSDTILCFYVLNVLLPGEQAEVLMSVSNLFKPNGKAYFAVRRDIQYERFRIHKVHKKETYPDSADLQSVLLDVTKHYHIKTSLANLNAIFPVRTAREQSHPHPHFKPQHLFNTQSFS
ncbi:methyltransferase domain-containing protein [Flavobacterium sp.]|jgi:SAM-dependent methyltransferase|uniref:methyltransferase domain-containing protein n=1 Tax=Flavobacterium sp. TaxID=239 RepID=UPI0022C5F944|nr:methyltransferase domain-containing protein [Flavobacterium sp.]MCZ8228571.1 methyltransferase domain-containing protein [Flavobacterium sp.]